MASSLKVNRVVPSTGTNIGLGTASGEIRLASTSKLTFDGDTDTYIHHPSANQLAITRAGGSFPIIRFGSGGSGGTITMGNTTGNLVTNSEILSVRGYSSFKSVSNGYAAVYTHNEGNTSGTFNPHILFNAGGANRGGFGYMPNTGELTLNHQYDVTIRTGTGHLGGAERIRFKNDGKILVGAGKTVTPRIVSTSVNAFHQIEGTTYHESALSITRNTDDQWGGYVIIGKSRGTSVGGIGTLTDGDIVGEFRFAACDGEDMVPMTALIRSEIDGAVGVNSTPGALTFRTTSAGNLTTSERLRIKADGNIVATGNIKSNNISGHNIIHNGAFNIAQRGVGLTTTTTGFQTVDRWRISYGNNSAPIWQKHIALTSGDPYDAGFRYSYQIHSVGHSAHNNAYCYAVQSIEARDIANSGWNYTSSSSYINLSFWVKANVTQNYLIFLHTNDTVIKEYCMLISLTANQWTKVTKAIPGNSGIVMNNDNGVGLQIWFTPALGTGYTSGSTVETWQTHAGYTSRPDIPSTWWTQSNALFEITGVQLEVGSTDTSFEHRSYGEELALCQRFYYMAAKGASKALGLGVNYTASQMHCAITFPVTMRAEPTLDAASGTNYYEFIRNGAADWFNSLSLGNRTTDKIGELYNDSEISGSGVVGYGGFVRTDNANVHVGFTAEI